MQNYVHRTREAALAAGQGRLVLAVCRSCGFAWNRAFEPGLLVYDDGYDNAVPSSVMAAYHAEIISFLTGMHPLEGSLVVDVGCGDGRFLRSICVAVAGSRGLGIDPALPGDSIEEAGRVQLVRSGFSAAVLTERPGLVVSRHVLEHIGEPVSFLQEIAEALGAVGSCPCFFEVPDLRWIVDHGAFWDICYEHCNYFTAESFGEALRRGGFEPATVRTAFGSQYLWLGAVPATKTSGTRGGEPGTSLVDGLQAYAGVEAARIAATRGRITDLLQSGFEVAVWGMATKGVLFSNLVDPGGTLIDHCIDANANKQGCFVPVTGHRIEAPSELRSRPSGRPLAILVMNDNYRSEIEGTCRELGVVARILSSDAS